MSARWTRRLSLAVLPVLAMLALTPVAASADEIAQPRRVVLVIDVSGSMQGAGIDAARAAAASFIDQVPVDVEVGIVAFDDEPGVVTVPTTDRDQALAAVAGLQARRETALYDAVAAGLELLEPGGADRSLFLLSDGGDTASAMSLPEAVAAIRSSGARVDVAGFRTSESEDDVLAQLAAAGRGRVTAASDAASVARAFAAAVPADLSFVHPPVAPWVSTPWPAVLLVAVVVLLVTLMVSASLMRPARPARMQQIEYYGLQGRGARPAGKPGEATKTSSLAQPVLDLAETAVRRSGREAKLELLLDRANMPWRPNEYVLLRCAAALAGAAAMTVMAGGWFLTIAGGVLGWAGLAVLVRVKAGRRMSRFAGQLPDALALIASSLKTGFSLGQALDAVTQDTADPLRAELGRAVAEARLGSAIEDALERVAERMACEDLRWTVMAIRIQRQVGGNLAETLSTTTVTLRDRASLRRHVKALSADGRFSAYVLIGLPIVLAVALWLLTPEFMSLLWSSLIGILLLVVAVGGLVIGSVWMRKLVRVEL